MQFTRNKLHKEWFLRITKTTCVSYIIINFMGKRKRKIEPLRASFAQPI